VEKTAGRNNSKNNEVLIIMQASLYDVTFGHLTFAVLFKQENPARMKTHLDIKRRSKN
jgi:hypothetical protein